MSTPTTSPRPLSPGQRKTLLDMTAEYYELRRQEYDPATVLRVRARADSLTFEQGSDAIASLASKLRTLRADARRHEQATEQEAAPSAAHRKPLATDWRGLRDAGPVHPVRTFDPETHRAGWQQRAKRMKWTTEQTEHHGFADPDLVEDQHLDIHFGAHVPFQEDEIVHDERTNTYSFRAIQHYETGQQFALDEHRAHAPHQHLLDARDRSRALAVRARLEAKRAHSLRTAYRTGLVQQKRTSDARILV